MLGSTEKTTKWGSFDCLSLLSLASTPYYHPSAPHNKLCTSHLPNPTYFVTRASCPPMFLTKDWSGCWLRSPKYPRGGEPPSPKSFNCIEPFSPKLRVPTSLNPPNPQSLKTQAQTSKPLYLFSQAFYAPHDPQHVEARICRAIS